MKKIEVQIALEHLARARATWFKAHQKFRDDAEYMMNRLLNEASANYLSIQEVASYSGLSVKQVRALMRKFDLDPKRTRTLLAKHAAKALTTNAELMGIVPSEMDLTSPLAYLPMGSEMKRRLNEAGTHRVTDVSVSGNDFEL